MGGGNFDLSGVWARAKAYYKFLRIPEFHVERPPHIMTTWVRLWSEASIS